MPALSNKRHEKYCQLVATGYTKRQSYAAAGFRDNRGNAALLYKRPEVQARIKELKDQNFQVEEKIKETFENAEEVQVDLSKKWVLDKLIQNTLACMVSNQRAAANRSLELLGKELGMFIDRTEVHATSELSRLSDEELLEKLKEEMLLQSTVTIDHEPATQDNEPESLVNDSGSEDGSPTIN